MLLLSIKKDQKRVVNRPAANYSPFEHKGKTTQKAHDGTGKEAPSIVIARSFATKQSSPKPRGVIPAKE